VKKRTFWALAILSVLLALAAAIALIDTDRLTVMPPRAFPDAELRKSTSTIMIPLSLSLDLIEKRLNEDLPESLHTFRKSGVKVKCWDTSKDLLDPDEDILAEEPERSCLYLDFEVWIMRNGHIDVSVAGEELILKVPARGRTVARGTGAVSKHLKKTARGEFTVTFRGKLDVTPDGTFDLRLSSAYEWGVPVYTKVFGKQIDLRKPIDKLLRKGLDKVEGKAQKVVRDQLRLGEKTLGTYRRLLEPVRVGRDPDVWMVIIPKALHFTGIKMEENRVLAPIAVEADLRTHVGARPEHEPPQALPVIDGQHVMSSDFVVNLPIVLSYTFLQEELEKKLAGTGIPLGKMFPGASVVITKTHFYPTGEKLALGVDFHTRGVAEWLSADGTLFLVGTPRVDNEAKALSVTDLTLTRRTSNSFLDLGSFLLYRPLLSFLSGALHFSLEGAYTEVAGEAEAAFNRSYPHGITLKGSMKEVAISEIQARKEDLVVYARGHGRLEALWLDN
jgi:hypothetical protein